MKFVKQDCWIGLFWKTVIPDPICHCGMIAKYHGYYCGHFLLKFHKKQKLFGIYANTLFSNYLENL